MTVQIIRGDARTLPLADDSVDLIVTSPPYFGLRSYQDGGEHYAGQLGDESTPAEFVDALVDCTREWMRVLKPSGSMWVNLGDKYSTYESRPGKAATHEWAEKSQQATRYTLNAPDAYGVKYKSLIGIPWRYALRCIDDLGLILRAEVIWSKPNGLPESVTDRVRRSHEQWFHFTLQPRYFSAVDEIREPHSEVSIKRAMPHRANPGRRGPEVYGGTANAQTLDLANMNHPLGKLPGSVWTVPTEPLRVPESLGVDHFAAFPTEWPRRIIAGWSPSGVCTGCGEGRRPVVAKERLQISQSFAAIRGDGDANVFRNKGEFRSAGQTDATITGYACACPDTTAPTTPALVLDPFGGTGTTALVAHALGRHGISNDMSADYCRLARWRTTDPAQLAKAMGVTKPPVEIDGQADLFGEDVA